MKITNRNSHGTVQTQSNYAVTFSLRRCVKVVLNSFAWSLDLINLLIHLQDELNAELEELEQEELDERLLDVAGTAQLPSVPDTEMPVPAGKIIIMIEILRREANQI